MTKRMLVLCFALFSTFLIGQTVTPSTPDRLRLTVHEAEQLALRQNPGITIAKLVSLAQGQVTREVRSSELPTASANLTAVDSHEGSRITAGGLNNPVIYPRAAGGVSVSQLITDFGRTRNLVASARLRANAAQAQQQATQADVLLAVDQAFYSALQSQALVNVASQTVATRQTTTDQVQALANAKLKSDLDLSFANVNLAQAKLMLLDADDQKAAAFAALNTLLGFEKQNIYELIDETSTGTVAAPPMDSADLIARAMQSRPDLRAMEDQMQAAEKFSRAEHDLLRPTVSALAAVGGSPVRADQLSPWYGAAGVNVGLPIFNGFQYSARAKEADYRALEMKEQVRDVRNHIARDVQVTAMSANAAYQRINVTAQLLNQANVALDLAQTRYKLGLSSIVELSQAELQQTEAEIGNTVARYQYQQALSSLAFQVGR
jgi:outer membrane protein